MVKGNNNGTATSPNGNEGKINNNENNTNDNKNKRKNKKRKLNGEETQATVTNTSSSATATQQDAHNTQAQLVASAHAGSNTSSNSNTNDNGTHTSSNSIASAQISEKAQIFDNLVTKINDLTCGICLCKPHEPTLTSCGHIFCKNCIRKWEYKDEKNSCPTCRVIFAPTLGSTTFNIIQENILSIIPEKFLKKPDETSFTRGLTPEGVANLLKSFHISLVKCIKKRSFNFPGLKRRGNKASINARKFALYAANDDELVEIFELIYNELRTRKYEVYVRDSFSLVVKIDEKETNLEGIQWEEPVEPVPLEFLTPGLEPGPVGVPTSMMSLPHHHHHHHHHDHDDGFSISSFSGSGSHSHSDDSDSEGYSEDYSDDYSDEDDFSDDDSSDDGNEIIIDGGHRSHRHHHRHHRHYHRY